MDPMNYTPPVQPAPRAFARLHHQLPEGRLGKT